MLFLLSPAKSLDYDTPVPEGLPHTTPQFVPQSTALIDVLREQSPQQIASLMELSDTLAALNVARYQAWRPRFTAHNSRQAVLVRTQCHGGPSTRKSRGRGVYKAGGALRRKTRRSGVEDAGAKA